MKILIVGAGIVGFNLAQELSHEGHDISIIDENAERIKTISEKLDVLAVHGNGCIPSTLLKAQIRGADMVISVTDKDEINLMVCFLGQKFGIPKRFARLRNVELTGASKVFSPQELFVDYAINPGEIVVDSLLKIIKTPSSINVAEFAGGHILLRGFEVSEEAPLVGKTIKEIRSVSEMNSFMVVALVRDGHLRVPKFEDTVQPKDKAYIVIDNEFLPLALPMFNKKVEEIHKVIMYGANPISINLAQELHKFIQDVSIIEPNHDQATTAADSLENTVILHGNGTDPDLFNDINMKDADLFLALSDNDEMNILSALLAKKHGAKRAAVLTSDPDYLPILDSIGMDISINPRLITVSAILKHLRKGEVLNVHKLAEGEAEVMEILVHPKSSAVGKRINQLRMPTEAIIGAIVRKGEMIVPAGATEIEAEDTVILTTLPHCLEKVEKIFSQKTGLFS